MWFELDSIRVNIFSKTKRNNFKSNLVNRLLNSQYCFYSSNCFIKCSPNFKHRIILSKIRKLESLVPSNVVIQKSMYLLIQTSRQIVFKFSATYFFYINFRVPLFRFCLYKRAVYIAAAQRQHSSKKRARGQLESDKCIQIYKLVFYIYFFFFF